MGCSDDESNVVGWQRLVKYEKVFTKRVCVENARSAKGTGKREGDGWHGLAGTKRVSRRGKNGSGAGRKRGVNGVQSENRKGNCGVVCVYRRGEDEEGWNTIKRWAERKGKGLILIGGHLNAWSGV